MEKWKMILMNIKYFLFAFWGLVAFAFLMIWLDGEAVKFGFVAGVILSVGLAFAVTMAILKFSNDAGANKGEFKDFTEEPMEFLD